MKRICLACSLLFLARGVSAQTNAPELVLQVGHAAAVTTMDLSPDQSAVATGSRDGSVKLWNAATHGLLFSLPHGAPVLAVRFNPSGQLITATSGGAIRWWNPTTGALRRLTPGNKIAATAAAISSKGDLVAFGLPDGKILLRESDSGRSRTLEGHPTPLKSLAFSPDDQLLASTSEAFRKSLRMRPSPARQAMFASGKWPRAISSRSCGATPLPFSTPPGHPTAKS